MCWKIVWCDIIDKFVFGEDKFVFRLEILYLVLRFFLDDVYRYVSLVIIINKIIFYIVILKKWFFYGNEWIILVCGGCGCVND